MLKFTFLTLCLSLLSVVMASAIPTTAVNITLPIEGITLYETGTTTKVIISLLRQFMRIILLNPASSVPRMVSIAAMPQTWPVTTGNTSIHTNHSMLSTQSTLDKSVQADSSLRPSTALNSFTGMLAIFLLTSATMCVPSSYGDEQN